MAKKLAARRVITLGAALVACGFLGFFFLHGMIEDGAPGHKAVNAFYCSVITLTTVGYGDVCPSGNMESAGKTFLVFFSFAGLGFFCGPIMDLAASWKNQVPGGIISIASLTLAIGIFLFTYLENMSHLEAAYFSVITGTTIGYGDISPSSDVGKVAVALYAIVMVNVVGGMLEPAKAYLMEMCLEEEEEKTDAVTKKTDEAKTSDDKKDL
eukprot:CAMPEP_0194027002 /NCGR_PEP_ID=MMETSP0009_2-20130614/1236_1 /TAXON_ID=210454 /ORGANISM="Grammatophora oceanica, Strain CCMP 410" /LENGTH=210 /DNA_ID=CAMNT_0038665923 /DNA_START=156 /DNA_END=788 /DNA_ORIENTATION=-